MTLLFDVIVFCISSGGNKSLANVVFMWMPAIHSKTITFTNIEAGAWNLKSIFKPNDFYALVDEEEQNSTKSVCDPDWSVALWQISVSIFLIPIFRLHSSESPTRKYTRDSTYPLVISVFITMLWHHCRNEVRELALS